MNTLPILKTDANVIFLPDFKGTGKTFQMLRESYIYFDKEKKPSFYVRDTFDQVKIFKTNYKNLLQVLGYEISPKDEINNFGHFWLKSGKRGVKGSRELLPKINFFSINQAMNFQSSKAPHDPKFAIFDEIQNHFTNTSMKKINKMVNLILSILRESKTVKIIIIFNPMFEYDPLLEAFNLQKAYQNQKTQFRKYLRYSKNKKPLKLAIYKPKITEELKKSKSESVAEAFADFFEYGQIATVNDFVNKEKTIKYINKYGNFKYCLSIDNIKFGFWEKGSRIQISFKYPKYHKTIYFKFDSQDQKYIFLGKEDKEDFKNELEIYFIKNKIEYSSYSLYNLITRFLLNKT